MLLTAKQQLAAERELCERSFADFIARAWKHCDNKPFLPNWHIKVLADHLQAAFEGKIQYLLINIPPGSAKSLITSVMFPAWCWARDKQKKIISAAHNRELSSRDSKRCRRLIQSAWYQSLWPVSLMDDQDSKSNFENEAGGARIAMALTAMTGHRGSIIIVDDPHSVRSAKSPAKRKEAVESFLETVPSRLDDPDKDVIIVIMQRLHEQDVVGAILELDTGYDHLCIPLFADGEQRKPTSIGWIDTREEGENMHPERYTERYIDKVRRQLGPYGFAGQYQQRPAPDEDGYFHKDWFKRFHPSDLPANLNYYMTSDHAPGGKGDYNVLRIWGIDAHRNLWLVDSFREKCIMDEALGIERIGGVTRLKSTGALPMIRKWKPLGWYPENDNTWAAIKGFVRSAMLETDTFCRIIPLATKGSGDKEGKAQAYQAMASMGLVHLPIGAVGDAALTEYATFPAGKHDDQVDADGAIARVIDEALPAYVAPTPQPQTLDIYETTGASEGWY